LESRWRGARRRREKERFPGKSRYACVVVEGERDMNVKQDVVAIARASYGAYVDKDRAAIEALIADDFHFTSPLDNRIDRTTYFARCWPNSATIAAFDFTHIAPDGDRAFVAYEAQNIDGRRFRNSEILTVRDGKIIDVEVYFGWTIPHEAAEGDFVNPAKP
jgi:ketosteroid isomerase-like protein